jgi:hypothetical protein
MDSTTVKDAAEYAKVLGLVTIAGLAIQQTLQIIDPLVMALIAWIKSARTKHDLPGGMSDGDFKKALVACIGTIFGYIAVRYADIHTICFLLTPADCGKWPDQLVSSLVLGAGTEGVNTLIKYFGYVKDARKQALDVIVTILPPSPTVKHAQTFHFTARVENGTSEVIWSVLQSDGGTINQATGEYAAPAVAGTYQISCVSKSDPTRPSFATVTVT